MTLRRDGSIERWAAKDAGCIADGANGTCWVNERAIHIAAHYGLKWSGYQEASLLRYGTHHELPDDSENAFELASRAIDWLNEKVAIDGFSFSFVDGDFLYIADAEMSA